MPPLERKFYWPIRTLETHIAVNSILNGIVPMLCTVLPAVIVWASGRRMYRSACLGPLSPDTMMMVAMVGLVLGLGSAIWSIKGSVQLLKGKESTSGAILVGVILAVPVYILVALVVSRVSVQLAMIAMIVHGGMIYVYGSRYEDRRIEHHGRQQEPTFTDS